MVFEDKNANGIRNPGEPGIAGARVMITDSSGEVQIKVTNTATGSMQRAVGTTATIIVERPYLMILFRLRLVGQRLPLFL
jgi:hypothetical protein